MTDPSDPVRRFIDVRRVERAALLMHFDDVWIARVLEEGVLSLSSMEKALFRSVDRRGFRSDGERAARAATAIVAELPVAVGVAGVPRLLSFFRDPAFVDVIVGGTPLVVGAARFLDNPPARIECAIACARRRDHAPDAAVVVAPAVAAAVIDDGTLAAWLAARESLGEDVVATVGSGQRIAWDARPAAAAAPTGVLVRGAGAAPVVGGCAAALARLLGRLETGSTLAAYRAAACAEGCDDDAEADALLDDLVADGLLVRR